MGRRTSKPQAQAEADDEFHLADTEEIEQLEDIDTDVLETLSADADGDSEHSPGDSPGFDPYNNSKAK